MVYEGFPGIIVVNMVSQIALTCFLLQDENVDSIAWYTAGKWTAIATVEAIFRVDSYHYDCLA